MQRSKKHIPTASERADAVLAAMKKMSPVDRRIADIQVRDLLVEAFTDASKDGLRRAGAKGGRKTAKVHGEEHYQEIGRKGGATVKKAVALMKAKASKKKGE